MLLRQQNYCARKAHTHILGKVGLCECHQSSSARCVCGSLGFVHIKSGLHAQSAILVVCAVHSNVRENDTAHKAHPVIIVIA